MGAAMNGMAAHGGMIPFGSTFLIFSDYMRPSMRLAALMELGVIYVFTHDSIGVGRRRADPPAGGAIGGPSRHPASDCDSPRRCQRDRGRLADRDRKPLMSGGVGA